MNAPLDVFARLSVVDEKGKEISVNADKEIVTVMLPSLWIGRPVLGQLADRQRRTWLLDTLHDVLKTSDLAIEFRIAHRVIALIGPQSKPGFLSRIVGLGPLELKIVPILLSLFKR
jgi:hypothetical protein